MMVAQGRFAIRGLASLALKGAVGLFLLDRSIEKLQPGKPALLATCRSFTSGSSYDIRLGKDSNVYCSCPNWKYQPKHPQDRSCKHIDDFMVVLRYAAAMLREAA